MPQPWPQTRAWMWQYHRSLLRLLLVLTLPFGCGPGVDLASRPTCSTDGDCGACRSCDAGVCVDDPTSASCGLCNSGAKEQCGNGIDDDCDGSTDEGCITPCFGGSCEATGVTRLGDGGGELHAMQPLADGGFVLVGTYYDSLAADDVWVVRLDSDGAVVWQKHYGGEFDEHGRAILPTTDGGFLFVGQTETFSALPQYDVDLWLVKLGSTGDIQWQRSYGGRFQEIVRTAVPLSQPDGWLVLVTTGSFGLADYATWMLRFDGDGALLWQQMIANDTWATRDVRGATQTPGGGIICAGMANDKAWIVELDADGNVLWENRYPEGTELHAIVPSQGGGYVAAGEAGPDLLVMRIDTDGNILWQHAYGGDSVDEGRDVVQASNGELIVAGITDSFPLDMRFDRPWLLRLSPAGEIIWQRVFSHPEISGVVGVDLLPDGRVAALSTEPALMLIDGDGQITASGCTGLMSADTTAAAQTLDGTTESTSSPTLAISTSSMETTGSSADVVATPSPVCQ